MTEHPSANPEWDQYIRDDWNTHITPPPAQPVVDGPPQMTAPTEPVEDVQKITAAHIDQLLDMKDFHGVAGERVFDLAVAFLRGRYRVVRDGAWNQ